MADPGFRGGGGTDGGCNWGGGAVGFWPDMKSGGVLSASGPIRRAGRAVGFWPNTKSGGGGGGGGGCRYLARYEKWKGGGGCYRLLARYEKCGGV